MHINGHLWGIGVDIESGGVSFFMFIIIIDLGSSTNVDTGSITVLGAWLFVLVFPYD